MKRNAVVILELLLSGQEVMIGTRTYAIIEGRLMINGYRSTGSYKRSKEGEVFEPEFEEVWLGCDISLDYFIKMCEKEFTDEQRVSAVASKVLTDFNKKKRDTVKYPEVNPDDDLTN